MRNPEKYWDYKGPPIPEAQDLPLESFDGGEGEFGSLSPGMRRAIWRDAIHREARERQLPEEVVARVRVATISGSLASLDEYLAEFERKDASLPAIPEDADRLLRANQLHRKGEVQISSRDAL